MNAHGEFAISSRHKSNVKVYGVFDIFDGPFAQTTVVHGLAANSTEGLLGGSLHLDLPLWRYISGSAIPVTFLWLLRLLDLQRIRHSASRPLSPSLRSSDSTIEQGENMSSGVMPSTPSGPDTSRGPALLSAEWVTLSIAVLFVALRIYTRALLHKTAGWDDWTILAALVSRTKNHYVQPRFRLADFQRRRLLFLMVRSRFFKSKTASVEESSILNFIRYK